jgi:hypothetical protein
VATLYSTLFGVLRGVETGSVTLYTVPAGYLMVLRDVDLLSNSAGATQVFIQDGGGAGAWKAFSATAQFQSFQWQGRQVYPAGHELQVVLASGLWIGRFSGYLLTAP